MNVGLYPDGRPGELFITMAKEGSTVGGLMDSFGTAISMSLQYGVPLEVLVNKFSHTRFEPMGNTTNPDIRIAKSMVDYIFRWMGITFLAGYREASTGMNKADAPPPAAAATQRLALVLVLRLPRKSEPVAKGRQADGNGAPEGNDEFSTSARYTGSISSSTRKPCSVPVWPWPSQPTASSRRTQRPVRRFPVGCPSCDNCGAITVRNGNCYLCHNCGNSMGCS